MSRAAQTLGRWGLVRIQKSYSDSLLSVSGSVSGALKQGPNAASSRIVSAISGSTSAAAGGMAAPRSTLTSAWASCAGSAHSKRSMGAPLTSSWAAHKLAAGPTCQAPHVQQMHSMPAAAPSCPDGSTELSTSSGSGGSSTSAAGSSGTLTASTLGEDDEGVLLWRAGLAAGGLPAVTSLLLLGARTTGSMYLGRTGTSIIGVRSYTSRAASAVAADMQREVAAADARGAPAPSSPTAPSAAPSQSARAFREQHNIQLVVPGGQAVPDPCTSFADAPFAPRLLNLLSKSSYSEPTPIQAQAWPVAMERRDLVAIASTGSGKTAGFLLPALSLIQQRVIAQGAVGSAPASGELGDEPPRRNKRVLRGVAQPQVLVLAPTRELVQQIHAEAEKFGHPLRIPCSAVYGGADRRSQIRGLSVNQPAVLVASPGRLLDLEEMGHVSLDQVQYLVLDEADRMLDMGFEDDVLRIVELLPRYPARQTLFFSATWPSEVRGLAGRVAGSKPVQLFIGDVQDQPVAARTIQQEVVVVGKAPRSSQIMGQKVDALVDYIQQLNAGGTAFSLRGTAAAADSTDEDEVHGAAAANGRPAVAGTRGQPQRVLIFAATKSSCDWLVDQLSAEPGMPRVAALHGDKTQRDRERTLLAFRAGRVPLLVATDVAARGLDVPAVMAVVNFDVPNPGRAEDYVHRIGRTGRAGARGRSLAILNASNNTDVEFGKRLVQIMREAHQPIPRELEELTRSSHRGGGHSGRHGSSRGRGGYGGRSRSSGGFQRRGGGSSYGSDSSRSSGRGGYDSYDSY